MARKIAENDDCVLLHWPSRFPDLTPCDFFLWGCVKSLVYVPPLLTSVDNLKTRITEVLITINPDMLVRVWQEMEYNFRCVPCNQGLAFDLKHKICKKV